MKKQSVLALFLFIVCAVAAHSQASLDSIKNSVYFLASDSLAGRKFGSPENLKISDFIQNYFKSIGLKPFGSSYKQRFAREQYRGYNVIGYIEGSDPILKNEYIVIGAHFDHLGIADEDKQTKSEKTIFNNGNETNKSDTTFINPINKGANDNASGSAVMLELARQVAANKQILKRSLIFIAFDGEEEGLWGSSYFVEHSPVELSKIKFMISIDMIGDYKNKQAVYAQGYGSIADGEDFIKTIKKVENLNTEFESSAILWKDMTDTSPFYYKQISCLHINTGMTDYYHSPRDTPEMVDYDGLAKICNQTYNILVALNQKKEIKFRETKELIREQNSSAIFGIEAGFGNSNFHFTKGPFEAKPLKVYDVGLTSRFQVSRQFALKVDALYLSFASKSQMGDTRINYLNIPAVFNFITPPYLARLSVGLGGYYGYGLNGKIDGKDVNWRMFNRNDYGAVIELGVDILNINVNFRTNYSLNQFNKNYISGIGKMQNQSYTMGFSWHFLP